MDDTPELQVLSFLHRFQGRRQKTSFISERLGWDEETTAQVLAGMVQEGLISSRPGGHHLTDKGRRVFVNHKSH